MLYRQKRHSIDSLFTFLLLLSFCLFTMMLAGMGAAVYKNSTAKLDENYTSRTAIAYVSEKVRQYDREGCIFLTEVENLPALALRDTIDGEQFLTYIYFCDHYLCELFTREENTPAAAMGTRLVELSDFTIRPAAENTDGTAAGQTASETSYHLFSVTAVSPGGNELSALIHCY